jgi:hypothetical protein
VQAKSVAINDNDTTQQNSHAETPLSDWAPQAVTTTLKGCSNMQPKPSAQKVQRILATLAMAHDQAFSAGLGLACYCAVEATCPMFVSW